MNLPEKQFYHLFWTNSTCRSIFSVHKAQLLESEVELILSKEKFYAQRIVLSNSQKRKTGLQIAKRTENETIELIHNFKTSVEKYIDEKKIETYLKSKFGKTIKKVEKDLSKKGWLKIASKLLFSLETEKDFFKLLSEYHLIPSHIETEEHLTEHIEIEVKRQLKKFLKEQNLSDLAISIDLISTFYNNKIKHNLVSASKHYTDIFYDNENYNNRIAFFDDLYEIKVIKGGRLKSHYECVNCPPNTINGVLTLNLKPSSLKIKCPNCKKEMHYIVPYELDLDIYKSVIHKDGILFNALKYLFEENNYSFSSNQTFLKDVEIDFCLEDVNKNIYELVEIKMFKTDRPEDTQIGNLRSAVGQLKKIIDKLSTEVDERFKSIQHSIVTNIYNDSVYKKANIELMQDLNEYNIKIYTIDNYYMKIKK